MGPCASPVIDLADIYVLRKMFPGRHTRAAGVYSYITIKEIDIEEC